MKIVDAGGDVLEQVAFHGSPYRFDRFSLDASGTGEGGAAHGHGLYFSADRNVATGCRVQLAGPEYTCKGRSLDDLYAQPERSGERDKMAVLEDFMVKHDLESMELGDFDPAAAEWFKEIHKDIRGGRRPSVHRGNS